MHPLDALAADPGRLAEVEAAAREVATPLRTPSAADATVSKAAVLRLDALLWPAIRDISDLPTTPGGMRLWRLVEALGDLTEGARASGSGHRASAPHAHARAVDARRGDHLRVRGAAFRALSDLVRTDLLPPEADPDGPVTSPVLLAEIEDAARAVSWSICSYSDRVVIDEASVLRLADLLDRAPGFPYPDGQRVAGIARHFDALQKAVCDRGRGPVAPTFDEHDRAEEARRGGWLVVRRGAHEAFSDIVRGPDPFRVVTVRGTDRASGDEISVRASTVDQLRQRLAALGVARVEVTGWVAVDSHGASWTDTYALADLPDTLLDQVRKLEATDSAGVQVVFDVEA